MMKSLIAKTEAYLKQEADIRKVEEEEAYQKEPSSTYWPPQCQEEEPSQQLYGQSYSCFSLSLRQSIFKIGAQEEESSPIYDHLYSFPHQQYQEEPPSPKRSTLEEAMARLDKTMSAFLSKAKEDRQTFKRINNSITQLYEKMDAHFKQTMDILKEEKCQGQLVANPNEYYMEYEYAYYLEQTTTKPGNEETVEENFVSQVLKILWESALIKFVSKLWLKIKSVRGRRSKLRI
jgi:hypothetical protein